MFRFPEPPRDVWIERITCVDVIGTSPKMIGKNAVRDDHGDTTTESPRRVHVPGWPVHRLRHAGVRARHRRVRVPGAVPGEREAVSQQ